MVAELRAESLWEVPERRPEAEAGLQQELGISPLLAAVLVRRGFDSPEAAARFLNPELDGLHDPRLLPDYDKAESEILGAKERGETIFVHGDYDVDGVSSTALFSRFLGRIGCKVLTHVPHRMREGYGIHASAVDEAAKSGAKLFLTCDCGISAIEQVERAHAAGMRVVVTDHHTVGRELPAAEAVVNPHRSDSSYPFSDLSGAGVAYKVAMGIAATLGLPMTGFHRAFLDLAALGTIADVMPLLDENRVIARYGLEQIRESKKPGIRALLRESRIEERASLRTYDVSFGIGPRLNAAGRLDDAALSLQLLLAQDDAEAAPIARRIEELNTARRTEQDRIVEEALVQVAETGQADSTVIVVWGERWHPGIIGIVAGKLVDRFGRPSIVLSVDPESGKVRGSARSIAGFHMADAVRAHSELIEGGGHAMAAGFSGKAEELDDIAKSLASYGAERLKPEDLVRRTVVDAEVEAREADFAAAESLSALEPFGEANPEPAVVVRGVPVEGVKQTRNPDHPQLLIRPDGIGFLRAPAFGLGRRLSGVEGGFVADLLIQPSIDEWQGQRRLRWAVRDLKTAD